MGVYINRHGQPKSIFVFVKYHYYYYYCVQINQKKISGGRERRRKERRKRTMSEEFRTHFFLFFWNLFLHFLSIIEGKLRFSSLWKDEVKLRRNYSFLFPSSSSSSPPSSSSTTISPQYSFSYSKSAPPTSLSFPGIRKSREIMYTCRLCMNAPSFYPSHAFSRCIVFHVQAFQRSLPSRGLWGFPPSLDSSLPPCHGLIPRVAQERRDR